MGCFDENGEGKYLKCLKFEVPKVPKVLKARLNGFSRAGA